MRPVFACRCCGFVSAIGTSFTPLDGVLVGKECADDIRAGREPETRWFNEVKSADRRTAKAA